jgi:type IV pilus assembly protein PilN
MIRINLLPVKELRAEVTRRREIIIGSVVLGLAVVLLIASYSYQSYNLRQLEKEFAELRAELVALNLKVSQVGDLQNRVKEFNGKHKVIVDLNKKKIGPVGVMESLAAATPPRLWLTEFKEVGGKLMMNGFAADNQTVADFLKALARTDYFRDVELVETTQATPDRGQYKRFSIRSMVFYLPQAPTSGDTSRATTRTEEKKG